MEHSWWTTTSLIQVSGASSGKVGLRGKLPQRLRFAQPRELFPFDQPPCGAVGFECQFSKVRWPGVHSTYHRWRDTTRTVVLVV